MNIKNLKKTGILFLLMLSWISIFSQESWEFGNKYKAYVKTNLPPLLMTMYKGSSLKDAKFVSKVGGIAFLNIAVPDSTVKGKNIKLEYNSNKTDGYRLNIIIGKDTTSPFLPDWQLIPIVNYANSENNACVSLFGDYTTKLNYGIQYHPAFNNTLLGIRILQADMALMNLETNWQLPKYIIKDTTNIVIGKGENLPDSISWIIPSININNILDLADFQSWVLTDDGIKVVFNNSNNKFSIIGEPYYYFWKLDTTFYSINRNLIILECNSLVSQYNVYVRYYNIGDTSYGSMLKKLDKEIFQKKEELKNIKPDVKQVTKITENLKNKYELLLQYNPAVYNATKNVMQYSAFFRYVKKNYKKNWGTFYNSCYMIQTIPVVKTPTTMPKKQI